MRQTQKNDPPTMLRSSSVNIPAAQLSAWTLERYVSYMAIKYPNWMMVFSDGSPTLRSDYVWLSRREEILKYLWQTGLQEQSQRSQEPSTTSSESDREG